MNMKLEDRLAGKREKYYIRTTGGNVMYDSGEDINVQVAPEYFLRKKVEDLSTGEVILFDVNHVRTTLEDVEPYLERSPLYSRASGFVYERNSRDEIIPRFRQVILNSLARRRVINGENLQSRIMMEGEDFSNEEYEQASEYLMETMLNSEYGIPNIHIPELPSIEAWIRGRTLAPRDHRVFRVLERELGDQFSEFISNPDDNNGFYKNYRIYVVLRQAVMKTLNHWRGIRGPLSTEETRRRSRINISEEINTITSHFLKNVTENLKCVMVTEIEKGISQNREYDARRRDRLLGEGVVRGIVQELSNNMKSFPEILEDFELLEGYFESAIMQTTLFPNVLPVGREQLMKHELPYLLRLFREPLDPDMLYMERHRNHLFNGLEPELRQNNIEFRDQFLEDMKNAILSGTLDADLGFKHGTMTRLIESCFRTRRALPSIIWDYTAKCKVLVHHTHIKPGSSMPNKEKKARRKEVQRLKHYILNNYEIQFDEFGKNLGGGVSICDECSADGLLFPGRTPQGFIDSILGAFAQNPLQQSTTPGEMFYENFRNDRSFVETWIQNLSDQVFIRTRDYNEHILTQYGLEEIVDLRGKDFILEGMGFDFPRSPGF